GIGRKPPAVTSDWVVMTTSGGLRPIPMIRSRHVSELVGGDHRSVRVAGTAGAGRGRAGRERSDSSEGRDWSGDRLTPSLWGWRRGSRGRPHGFGLLWRGHPDGFGALLQTSRRGRARRCWRSRRSRG